MKKVLSAFGAILLIICLTFLANYIGNFAFSNANETNAGTAKTSKIYPTTGVVTEISYEEDSVTLTDATGETWMFYGCEDWQKGDICSLLMDDKGTELIYDDEILKPIYSGVISDYITSESDVVDMSKVTGYEVTETGLLLHFEDGTGYYLER